MSKNISDIENFKKTVNRPLILDGAVGSLLQQQGINDKELWTSRANITQKEKVINVHRMYAEAGADILTTNTFRTNPLAFENSGLDLSYTEFMKQSVNLAAEAVSGKNIFIAASNSPAEDCYHLERKLETSELRDNHHKHIEELWNTRKVDFILNETFGHLDEIKIVCEFCSHNEIPFVISLFSIDGKNILSGESIKETVDFVKSFSPLSISFNCVFPEVFTDIYSVLNFDFSNAFYLNCGSGKLEDEDIECGISPEEYSKTITRFVNDKTFFVGSCCGSTPEHIKILRKYFDK